MNGDCIVKYAGAPVRFTGMEMELVQAGQASVFISEADAWLRVSAAKIPVNNVVIADRETELM